MPHSLTLARETQNRQLSTGVTQWELTLDKEYREKEFSD